MAFNGRELTVDWDAVTLVGVRSKTVNHSNSLVDVTTDDANGWRTLLATPGLKAVDISIDGVLSDEVMIAEFYNANATGESVTVNLPSNLASPGNIAGTFMLESIEIGSASHDGEVPFTMNLLSSGPVVYTASSA